MTSINPAAQAAQDAARRSNGEFGSQEHSAPEATLVDPKQKAVDGILAQRFGSLPDGALPQDALSMEDLRQLMSDAIEQYQSENPAIVVIDGEGKASDAAGVEVIDLDYLGEWHDDGCSAEFHIERATEDLDRIRAAGLESQSPSYQLREYLGNELDAEWWDGDEHVIEGVYDGYAVVSSLTADSEFTVRDAETGAIAGTYPTFHAAKAAALAIEVRP